MNNQLIAKVIKYNSKNCPNFVFDNPLLDKNLAGLLAKSFVKILAISNAITGSNNNLRHCILENIRKLCQTHSEGHSAIDENFHETLIQLYKNNIDNEQGSLSDSLERKLDMFLQRKLGKEEFCMNFKTDDNPELVQALLNLGTDKISDAVLTDLIYWDPNSSKCKNILEYIWINECDTLAVGLNNIDDISVKMKMDIEQVILNLVINSIKSDNQLIELQNEHEHLSKMCSKSPMCFQMTCDVLNHLFVKSNFNSSIAEITVRILNKIKTCSDGSSFSFLYKENLQSIVLLMDIDLSVISIHKEVFIENVLNELEIIKTESEFNLVMLLSHFPYWFDIYYENRFKS